MDWHALSLNEVYYHSKSSEKGLSNIDAEKKIERYGKNEIREIKKKRAWLVFLKQFNSVLIYILIISAIISFVIGHILDAIVIFIVVLFNSIIGFIQEYKAEKIIEKLKESLDYKVIVIRDEKQAEISSKFLVPGDIVIMDEGNRVLADCRIIKSDNLEINEAVLTGESFPVEKKAVILEKSTILAERKNMIYAGTTIVGGKCTAIVVSTANHTEFGKLAEIVQQTYAERAPLEKKLDSFSRKISFIVIALVAAAFFIGISSGIDKIQMFLLSISLVMSAIPEGLPAVIVITLAIAIKKMYKANTLIRKLPATETLGRTTVICTDKTGTLTKEELEVEKIYSGKFYSFNDKPDKNLGMLLKTGILCNNARDEEDNLLGDPTEIALIKSAKKFGIDKRRETEENIRLKEFVFSSERKMMSIIRESNGIKTSYVKGAPDIVIERSTKEFANGKFEIISIERKRELWEIYNQLSNKGLRVLGFAFRQTQKIIRRKCRR